MELTLKIDVKSYLVEYFVQIGETFEDASRKVSHGIYATRDTKQGKSIFFSDDLTGPEIEIPINVNVTLG